jgi:putative transposase
MERLFGTTNAQFIHNLQGNTRLMRHVRTVTKSVRPENFIEWTLPALHGALDYYASIIYGKEPHPSHGNGPVDYLVARLGQTGVRCNRWVSFDQTLMIETCPGPNGDDTRVIDGQRGVKVNHIWYWTDAFANASWRGTSVTVRIDPWDISRVYVLLGNQWHCCVSKLVFALKRYTAVELQYAYSELSKKQGKVKLSPERCAEWLRLYDVKSFDTRLRTQQEETRYLYDNLGMSDVGRFRLISEERQFNPPETYPSQQSLADGCSAEPLVAEVDIGAVQPKAPQTPIENDNNEPDEYELY